MGNVIRGDGETTRQMQAAPQGAIFVWCNGHTDYPRQLARKLGRDDLRIETPSFFEGPRWHGLRNALVIDHALDPFDHSRSWRDRYFEVMDYFQSHNATIS